MAVLRGPEYVFELANDACYRVIGDREIIGKALFEALPEVRGQGFEELLAAVATTGEPFIGREMPAMIARTPGAPLEERFIDFVYLLMAESDGAPSGILVHGSDVTEHVLARREVECLLAESEKTRDELAVANDQLQDQQIELEMINRQLQDSAVELEAQTEELQATAAQLEEQSEYADIARQAITSTPSAVTPSCSSLAFMGL